MEDIREQIVERIQPKVNHLIGDYTNLDHLNSNLDLCGETIRELEQLERVINDYIKDIKLIRGLILVKNKNSKKKETSTEEEYEQ